MDVADLPDSVAKHDCIELAGTSAVTLQAAFLFGHGRALLIMLALTMQPAKAGNGGHTTTPSSLSKLKRPFPDV